MSLLLLYLVNNRHLQVCPHWYISLWWGCFNFKIFLIRNFNFLDIASNIGFFLLSHCHLWIYLHWYVYQLPRWGSYILIFQNYLLQRAVWTALDEGECVAISCIFNFRNIKPKIFSLSLSHCHLKVELYSYVNSHLKF